MADLSEGLVGFRSTISYFLSISIYCKVQRFPILIQILKKMSAKPVHSKVLERLPCLGIHPRSLFKRSR